MTRRRTRSTRLVEMDVDGFNKVGGMSGGLAAPGFLFIVLNTGGHQTCGAANNTLTMMFLARRPKSRRVNVGEGTLEREEPR